MRTFSSPLFLLGTVLVACFSDLAFGESVPKLRPISGQLTNAMQCYNNAVATFNSAVDASENADTQGAIAAGKTSGAQLNQAGQQATGVANASTMQASASTATCTELATSARGEADACLPQATGNVERRFLQERLQKQFYPAADTLAKSCTAKAAGYAGTSSSLADMAVAMSLMTQIPAGGGSGGDSSGGGGGFDATGFTDTSTTPIPKITTVANARTPAASDTSSEPFKANLGDPVHLKAAGSEDASKALASSDAMSASSLPMVASSTSSSSDLNSPSVSRALAGSETGTNVAALSPTDKGKSGTGSMSRFTPFDFKDPSATDPAKPEEANDANYLGKTKNKNVSLAEIMAKKKRDDQAAKEAAKAKILASAAQAASQFKATPKSCAERQWKGKECQALKADPLLNMN